MSYSIFLTILAVALPVITAFAAYRLSASAGKAEAEAKIEQSRIAAKQIDAEAYERVRGIYEGGILQLRNELTDARAERERMRTERDLMQAERDRTKILNDQYESEIARLQESNARLEQSNMELLNELTQLREA